MYDKSETPDETREEMIARMKEERIKSILSMNRAGRRQFAKSHNISVFGGTNEPFKKKNK